MEAESEKEAAMEAELRAARERAVVPLEARMGQFRDMLLERGVHAPQHTTPVSVSYPSSCYHLFTALYTHSVIM